MSNQKHIDAGPKASSLIKSLKSIGYTFNDAISDLIDNSISARATLINIKCGWENSKPCMLMEDNGCGMDLDELIQAMTIGGKSPTDERVKMDLGRFGLGLKTASFSQTDILEVESWNDNGGNYAKWDLGTVIANNAWDLFLEEGIEKTRNSKSGTIVRWQNLDKGRLTDPDTCSDIFNLYIVNLEEHLSQTFHRYIKKDLEIVLNGVKLTSKSPFFEEKSAKSPTERIFEDGSTCTVSAYTLPHRSKCTAQEYKDNQGSSSYLEGQGFYLYRNNRLIVRGSWFGLHKKKDSTKLCRISIDIDSSCDLSWDLDIKKSSALPPPNTRRRLKALVDRWTANSRDRQLKRKRKLSQGDKLPFWERNIKAGDIQYLISKDNPFYLEILNNLNDDTKILFNEYMNSIQRNIPIKDIYHDAKEDTSSIVQPEIEINTLIAQAKKTIQKLVEDGMAESEAIFVIENIEHFRLRWKDIKEYL